MRTFHGHTSAQIPAAPADVFDVITDVATLPEWNSAIEKVVERPGTLTVGERWTVRMHPPHVPGWNSVSAVGLLDRQIHVFR